MADEPPIFGAKERAILIALIELWDDGVGEPIDSWQLAERLGWPWDFVWWPVRVCCRLKLAIEMKNGPVVDGWVPLVTLEQVPQAQPYSPPKPWRPAGKREARAAVEERRRRRNA